MINSIQMINWRAYDERTLRFDPGITFLMGPNGIGKTSVLEAIAYALTGEPSTLSDRTKLLRNPDRLATIRLEFAVDHETYLVERSQTARRAGEATIVRRGDGRRLASSHGQVTEQVERLMGVSVDFLRRIVYMAEGDVFRFLDDPPGDAINGQIRRVLGIVQMDEFLKALEMSERELKTTAKEIQQLLTSPIGADLRHGSDLEQRLANLTGRRAEVLLKIGERQRAIGSSRHDSAKLERLKPLLDWALAALRTDEVPSAGMGEMSVLDLLSQVETALAETEEVIRKCQVARARLEGEELAHQRILDLLMPHSGHSETRPCPVCGKPMTCNERESVLREVCGQGSRAEGQMERLRLDEAHAEEAQANLRGMVEALRSLRNGLVHSDTGALDARSSLPLLAQTVSSELARMPVVAEDLQGSVDEGERELAELERETAQFLTLQDRLRDMGFASPAEASDALIALETRSLAIRAAIRAAAETLTSQQTADLQALYSQIASVWGGFRGDGGWDVSLDKTGTPSLTNRAGRKFDLSQFSGGEKTALMIILHTIIAHHFSRSDFLLVDEPLEHLDPVNRRSLVRFLIDAHRRGGFRQAIVATFEESLVRKYMSEPDVNVLTLA